MSYVRASEAGIMKSKGRTRGLIPHAGSGSARQFVRRAQKLIAISQGLIHAKGKKKAINTTTFIPESRFRQVPARRKVVGARGRTSGGKSFPMEGGHIADIPATIKEFGGYRAFPGFALLPHISAGAQVRLATGVTRFGKGQTLVDIKGLKSSLNRLLAILGLPHMAARFVVWHVGRWTLMEIVWKTPVDTGQAAGGWAISPQLRGKQGYGRVGFRIKNPVPYAIFLEYGHSQKAPEGMMRTTFVQARFELRNLMDTLIMWWKNQQILLRNMRFDIDLAGGVPYNPAQVEQKIPKLSFQRLLGELKARLPLNKPVAHLNANVYLAMRIDDPKDWHTVTEDSGEHPGYPSGGFKEPTHVFEAHMNRRETPYTEVNEFDIQPSGAVLRTETEKVRVTRQIEHVFPSEGETPRILTGNELETQAEKLQRIWRGGK